MPECKEVLYSNKQTKHNDEGMSKEQRTQMKELPGAKNGKI